MNWIFMMIFLKQKITEYNFLFLQWPKPEECNLTHTEFIMMIVLSHKVNNNISKFLPSILYTDDFENLY